MSNHYIATILVLLATSVSKGGEREVANHLEKQGITLWGEPVEGFAVKNANVGLVDWNELCELRQLREIYLFRVTNPNSLLRKSAELDCIETLFLAGTSMTDGDFILIGKLQRLDRLTIWDSEITDVGLHDLIGLKRLQCVSFVNVKITTSGLAELSRLKALKYLRLIDANLTPAHLRELARFKNLCTLEITNSNVSEADLTVLKAALPKCKITR